MNGGQAAVDNEVAQAKVEVEVDFEPLTKVVEAEVLVIREVEEDSVVEAEVDLASYVEVVAVVVVETDPETVDAEKEDMVIAVTMQPEDGGYSIKIKQH